MGATDPNGQIASKLKALYSSVEQEPIPDTFLDLLEKLDQAERLGKNFGLIHNNSSVSTAVSKTQKNGPRPVFLF